MWRLIKYAFAGLVIVVIALLAPSAYVEAFCRADPDQAAYQPIIADKEFQRAEANSYLTYPEWHIVYAYEGLAKVLQTGDEHGFGYASSVAGFWRSFCALNRRANRHGGGDFATRSTVHTIGVSFTLELALKAAYEETIGRLAALVRGDAKSPQDVYAARMAFDYAGFLQQVPWYKYDFDTAVDELWALPADTLRGWERRLALGLEWKAKAAYAGVIASAVATTTGGAQLRIRSVIEGVTGEQLAAIGAVDIITEAGGTAIIETPRYRKFTNIVRTIADLGGRVIEIAGNDDIMVSVIEPQAAAGNALAPGEVISRIGRDGYASNRVLVGVRVADLAAFLNGLEAGGRRLEHIYDY